ncbi:MAG: hypothetical protein IT548_06935 [Alphaproteobacteria bacterium]|nr:hypothetical protein [Alphaproteobacteria bacterium]
MAFTREAKREAIERELGMRRRVYPRWVEKGRMSQRQADKEIAVMEAILTDYSAAAERSTSR